MTWRSVAALVTAAALLLGGCAGVPSGGRVITGNAAEGADQVDDPYVRLIPVPPRPEWGPQQIVSGFLAASASFDDTHSVARQYLASPSLWRPGPRPAVTVFKERQKPQVVEQTADSAVVRLSGQQLGTIDQGGQYIADPTTVEVLFELGKTPEGEWRVTGLPPEAQNGLLLSKSDVDRAFRTVNLFFFAPDRRTLVPNGIFLPLVNRQDLPAHLVRAVLDGPTAWLDAAVVSAFPKGTRVRSVTVSKEVATVDLSAEARGGDIERMSAQLAWTLRQLSEIKHWRLQIAGRTVSPDGVPATQPVRAWQANDPDGDPGDKNAYVIGAAGHLSQLLQDQPQPVATGPAGRLTRPSVAPDYVEVAGLNPEHDAVVGGDLVAGSVNIRTLLTSSRKGSRFTAPSWDREGRLWTVESTEDKSWLWVRQRRGGSFARVEHWGLSGRKVLAFRVSRDGVRAAAIVEIEGRAQVQIGRIVRRDGIDVGSFLPVSSELGGAIDLAWRDYGTLAVLGRKNYDSQVLAYLVPVSGGTISSLGVGALGTPESIAAAPHEPVLIGTTSAGKKQVCRQRSPRDRWSEWVCNIPASDPAYPG